MTELINYTLVNATTLTGALEGSAESMNLATGFDMFMPLMLLFFVLGGAVIGAKYGQAKSMTYAAVLGDIIAFLLTAAGLLNPIYLILILVLTMPLLFLKKTHHWN